MTELESAQRALVEGDTASEQVEALIEAMYLAATCDGDFAAEESAQFAATIEVISNGKLSAAGVATRVAALGERLKLEGRQARLASLPHRLAAGKPRETALILAASITAVDGQVQERENDLLADLVEALEIPTARAVDLVRRIHGNRA